MDLLASAGRLVQLVDVPALLEVVQKSQALGPVLEPTAYQRGDGQRPADQERFLRAAASFRAVCVELGGAWALAGQAAG